MINTAQILLVDPPGRQQSYYRAFSPQFNHGDEAILKVQRWLQVVYTQQITLADLAGYICMEERTFLRRFKKATGITSIDYCQRLRVDHARKKLQISQDPIDKIAWEVGYSDPSAFRKVFHRIIGLTPSEYRQRFNSNLH
ncbi:GlxA family transcriptional regulator [Acinetobacter johnsonii]|nr:helix-turn-helix domain-containing protein [Acinetobacter johnsonii]